MKKTFFTLLITIIFSNNFFAQSLKFGIKAGANYANVSGSEVQTTAITSYHAGLVAEINILDKLTFQPEILYSTVGATYKDALTEYKNELGYIAIPLMLKIGLSDSLSFDVGPQASFLLSEKNKFDYKNTTTFDFSGNVGVSLKITDALSVQGRYSYGLTSMTKDATVKNVVAQVSAVILF